MITITHPRTVIAVVVITIAAVVIAALFTSVDFFPALHTYGISVGTDTHYFSLEMVRGHLEASLNSGQ